MRKKLKRFEAFDIFVWLIALLALLVVLFPLLHVVSLSLSGASSIMQGKVTFYPQDFTFSSYMSILKSPKILNAYWNSISYTVLSVVISLVLITMTAYPLAIKTMPGRKLFINMILFTMFFSGGIIPFYLLMQNLKLMDSIWALVLPWAVPQFELFLLKNYFENIPGEIYEAATIDGASHFRIMTKIYMPLAKPIYATLVIFLAMHQWNNYMVPLMYISSPSKYPLQLVLNEMLMQEQNGSTSAIQMANVTPIGMKNATIVLSALPLLILYPFVQKYFIGSIYMGSVKG